MVQKGIVNNTENGAKGYSQYHREWYKKVESKPQRMLQKGRVKTTEIFSGHV